MTTTVKKTEKMGKTEMPVQDSVLFLISKHRRGPLRLVFSRVGLMALLLLLQLGIVFSLYMWFSEYFQWFAIVQAVFSVGMVFYLFNCDMDATAKLTWLFLIMLMPIPATILLWFTQRDLGHRVVKARIGELIEKTRGLLPQNEETLKKPELIESGTDDLCRYLNRTGCFPIYENTAVTYFPLGENKFAAMLEELAKAEKFIFMEYFIIDEGVMWGSILKILAEKAKNGVDVRVMYDGMCEMSTLTSDYPKRMEKLGIKCRPFSPISPFVSTHYNYRDHRKILVIDGKIAFNGGVNLADEYINRTERFGHWKDTAVMLKGEAVQSFTLMFLQMWNIWEAQPVWDEVQTPAGAATTAQPQFPVEPEPLAQLQSPGEPEPLAQPQFPGEPEPLAQPQSPGEPEILVQSRPSDGFVMPYCDCPLDNDKVGESVYMDILNRAKHYVHIMTPYLILDNELETALKFAAERGVDVRLILPGIPDKKAAYALAKSHYRSLTEAGVKIYEYTPGFVHAKVFVSDQEKAVVGTINLDYRSLYHHFECATYLYRVSCIPSIEEDFQKTLGKCREVTPETIRNETITYKILGAVMKLIAPLM